MPKVPQVVTESIVPKSRKSRSPKQEQQKVRETAAIVLKPHVTPHAKELAKAEFCFEDPNLPKPGGEGYGWAIGLKAAGYGEVEIARDLAKKAGQFAAESVEIERKANTPELSYTSEKQQTEKEAKQAENFAKLKAAQPAKPEPIAVANTAGIEVTKTEGGRVSIFGQPVTGVFRYCGSAGWSHEEAMVMLKSLGLEGQVSESTARIQMGAGKKGGDCGGRGPVPTFTQVQIMKLDQAAGRTIAKKIEESKLVGAAKPKKKAPKKSAKQVALEGIGMTKVKGALGGTYYE